MNYLMGIPVLLPEGMPEYKPYKGSIQVAADCCGCVVWQGPAQQLYKTEHPETPIYCALCLAKQAAADGEMPGFVSLTTKSQGE